MRLHTIINFCHLLASRAASTLLLIALIAGCSKQPQQQASEMEKQQPSSVSEQTAPVQEQAPLPSEPSVTKVPKPRTPSSRELEQMADTMGVRKEQVLLGLQRQQALWTDFKATLHSDNASQVVSKLLAMSNTVQGTPDAQNNGQRLPDSFLKMLGFGDSSVPGLEVEGPGVKAAKAGFMGLSVEKLPEQQVLAAGARELARMRPDLMTSLAQERAKAVSPSAADYILFNAIIEGLAESPFMESTGNNSEKPKTLPYGSELLALAKAPNPIYRLLAVRTARRAETDKAKLAGFYSGFLNETDPFIQAAAVDGLAIMRATLALSALQSFETKARQQGNAELEDSAKQAIKQLGEG